MTSRPVPATRRRLRTSLIILVVLVVVLVAADFAARFFAQAKIASEIQQHGFPRKPSVTIEGFPFLTQVASHDIHQIRISAQNVPEGPVQITRVSAVMTGIHLNTSFSSGTVDKLSGSVLVGFPALASMLDSQIGPLASLAGGSSLRFTPAGAHEVRASLSLVVASASATWRVSRLNGSTVHARLISSSNLPSSLLGPLTGFTVSLPRLPLGVKISNVQVTPAGISASISGHDLPFSGSG